MLWAQSGGARLSDGRADCNAPQHVSNTAATPWAEFQDREHCTPPTTTTTSPLTYLLPLSKHPRRSSSWREPVWRIDCRGVFCSSPRHQKGPLGPRRQGYSEGGFCFGSRPRSRVFRGAGDLNSIPLQSTARQVINQVCLFCCFSFSVLERYDSRMCFGCIRRLQCVVFFFFSFSSGGFQNKCAAVTLTFEREPPLPSASLRRIYSHRAAIKCNESYKCWFIRVFRRVSVGETPTVEKKREKCLQISYLFMRGGFNLHCHSELNAFFS